LPDLSMLWVFPCATAAARSRISLSSSFSFLVCGCSLGMSDTDFLFLHAPLELEPPFNNKALCRPHRLRKLLTQRFELTTCILFDDIPGSVRAWKSAHPSQGISVTPNHNLHVCKKILCLLGVLPYVKTQRDALRRVSSSSMPRQVESLIKNRPGGGPPPAASLILRRVLPGSHPFSLKSEYPLRLHGFLEITTGCPSASSLSRVVSLPLGFRHVSRWARSPQAFFLS